jgi:hypothetical protein
MSQSLEKVMDAIDIETFLVCTSEAEGRGLMLDILKGFGFTDADVVFAQFEGPGVRIRGRAYVHRPADRYQWLSSSAAGK